MKGSPQRPWLSIVVATWNAEECLEKCIASFADQVPNHAELIIVDGGSTDGTLDIIRKRSSVVAKWVSEPDQGIADAWNKGVGLASGDWILFLGADDQLYDHDTLFRLAKRLHALPAEVIVAYGEVLTEDELGMPTGQWGKPWEVVGRQFGSYMALPHQGVFHRRSAFSIVGGFDIGYRYAADYDWLLRALKRHPPHFIGSLVVTRMRSGGLSSKPSLSWRVLSEFRRSRKKNGLPGITLLWLWTFIKALAKGAAAYLFGDRLVTKAIRLLHYRDKVPLSTE